MHPVSTHESASLRQLKRYLGRRDSVPGCRGNSSHREHTDTETDTRHRHRHRRRHRQTLNTGRQTQTQTQTDTRHRQTDTDRDTGRQKKTQTQTLTELGQGTGRKNTLGIVLTSMLDRSAQHEVLEPHRSLQSVCPLHPALAASRHAQTHHPANKRTNNEQVVSQCVIHLASQPINQQTSKETTNTSTMEMTTVQISTSLPYLAGAVKVKLIFILRRKH